MGLCPCKNKILTPLPDLPKDCKNNFGSDLKFGGKCHARRQTHFLHTHPPSALKRITTGRVVKILGSVVQTYIHCSSSMLSTTHATTSAVYLYIQINKETDVCVCVLCRIVPGVNFLYEVTTWEHMQEVVQIPVQFLHVATLYGISSLQETDSHWWLALSIVKLKQHLWWPFLCGGSDIR